MSEALKALKEASMEVARKWGLPIRHQEVSIDGGYVSVESHLCELEGDYADADNVWLIRLHAHIDDQRGISFWAQPMMRLGKEGKFEWTQYLVRRDSTYGIPVVQQWHQRPVGRHERAEPSAGYAERVRETFEAEIRLRQKRADYAAALANAKTLVGADEDGQFQLGNVVGKVNSSWSTEKSQPSVRLDLSFTVENAEDIEAIMDFIRSRNTPKPAAPKP
jgi:hypothetical protein